MGSLNVWTIFHFPLAEWKAATAATNTPKDRKKSWTAGCIQERGRIKEEESEEGRNMLQKVSWDSKWLSHRLLSCNPPSLSWVYPFHVFLSVSSHTQITSLNPTRGKTQPVFRQRCFCLHVITCSLFFPKQVIHSKDKDTQRASTHANGNTAAAQKSLLQNKSTELTWDLFVMCMAGCSPQRCVWVWLHSWCPTWNGATVNWILESWQNRPASTVFGKWRKPTWPFFHFQSDCVRPAPAVPCANRRSGLFSLWKHLWHFSLIFLLCHIIKAVRRWSFDLRAHESGEVGGW